MYLLDTNVLSELIKRKPNSNFLRRLRNVWPEFLYTTSICVMELRYGCSKRNDRDRFWKSIEKEILSRIEVLPIGKEESIIAGDLLAYLHKKGTPIGIEDVLIASVCLSRHLTLITTNTKHFRLIPKIKVENWLY